MSSNEGLNHATSIGRYHEPLHVLHLKVMQHLQGERANHVDIEQNAVMLVRDCFRGDSIDHRHRHSLSEFACARLELRGGILSNNIPGVYMANNCLNWRELR